MLPTDRFEVSLCFKWAWLARMAPLSRVMMDFYLGTHQPGWLTKSGVPLMISFTRLSRYQRLPTAKWPWALYSGAFSQLIKYGGWTIPVSVYAESVRRMNTEIGRLRWASIQDWICSPAAIQHTGLTMRIHQSRTVDSLCDPGESAEQRSGRELGSSR